MSDANSHLASTIESLSKGLDKAQAGATRSIRSWTDTLSEANDSSLNTIADELEDLEDLLSDDEATAADFKKTFASLGKHTTAAAKKAEGATADKIKELGKMLTDAAASL